MESALECLKMLVWSVRLFNVLSVMWTSTVCSVVCTQDSPDFLAYAWLKINGDPTSSLYLLVTTPTQASPGLDRLFSSLTADVRRTSPYGSPEQSNIPQTSNKTVPRMMRLRIEASCSFMVRNPERSACIVCL